MRSAIRRGLDLMIRLLRGPGHYDTRWVTDQFFTVNSFWVIQEQAPVGAYGNDVASVSLTGAARAFWDEYCTAERNTLLTEISALLDGEQDYQTTIGEDTTNTDFSFSVDPTELDDEDPDDAVVPNDCANEAAPSRRVILECVVEIIQQSPFQAYYRGTALRTPPVLGWHNRMAGYFWPNPHTTKHHVDVRIAELCAQLQPLVLARVENRAWTPTEQKDAVSVAHHIFAWGGVRQTTTSSLVESVIDSVIVNARVGTAPMNSAYTKLAAFASACLPPTQHHSIFDSRVSHSLLKRIDTCVRGKCVSHLFPNLGWIPGRGGSRRQPPTYAARWPRGYGRWDSHIAASAVIREIAEILNNNLPRYGKGSGVRGTWTMRDVEMVLFMDGY